MVDRMQEEFFWTAVGLVWIFGWVTVWYLRRRSRRGRVR